MRYLATSFEVETTGRGRPVIFIPGFACSGRVWDSAVAHLNSEVEAHVVTFAGFVGTPPVREPSLARIHDELERYILDNELRGAVVVGHSLGGHMALWLAQTVSGLGAVIDVEGLPFLAAAEDPTMTEARAADVVQPSVAKLRMMTSDDLGAWIHQTMSGMFTHAADRDRVLNDSVRSDVETVARIFGEGVAKDLRAGLGRIDAPVTVVVSVADSPPATQLRTLWRSRVAGLPHVELIFMAGRHFVMYDQPRQFFALLDRVVGAPSGRTHR